MKEIVFFNKKEIVGVDESIKVDHKNAITFDVKGVTPKHNYTHLNTIEVSKHLISVIIRDVINKLNHTLLKVIENNTTIEKINKKDFLNELENNENKQIIGSSSLSQIVSNHPYFINSKLEDITGQMYKLGKIKNTKILIEPNLKWNDKTIYFLYEDVYNFDYKYILNIFKLDKKINSMNKINKMKIYCTFKKKFNSKRYILNE